ncbi:trans-aconitate 2-methyltransferase [Paenibacillus sp. SI8]|uniref:class I SAM-dependent methyltransferase n=1 Tax=unclassified Paenibacillus TaxID=185978 RepID=UPI003467DA44
MSSQVDRFDNMLKITTELFYPIEQELFLSAIDLHGKRILDVGCGNGAYMNRIHDSFPSARLTGVEYEENIYERAVRRTNEKMTFHHMSYEQLPVNQLFDVVILRLVIHHIPDKHHFCNWLKGVTHDQSKIVILEVDNEQLNDNHQLPLFSTHYKKSRQTLRKNHFLDVKDALKIEMEHFGLLHQRTTTYRIDASTSGNKIKLYDYMLLVAQNNVTSSVPNDISEELAVWFHDLSSTHEIHMFGMVFQNLSKNLK